MSLQDDEFFAQLLQTFREEAADHIQTIISGILEFERNDKLVQADEIEPVFRACHSLKGAARAVGLRDIETVCQNLESVFSSVRRSELILHKEEYDTIHQVIGALEKVLAGDKTVSSASLVKKIKSMGASMHPTPIPNNNSLIPPQTESFEEKEGIISFSNPEDLKQEVHTPQGPDNLVDCICLLYTSEAETVSPL